MIARKSALIIFTQLLNGLLGYIALKFIALYMQPWEYGVVGFAYSFVALFSIFGRLGFDQAHIKRVSEGKDLGECIATFVVTKTFLAGVMAGVVIGSVTAWKFILRRGFETPLHEQAIYIVLIYFVLLTLTQSFISTFNARKESAKAQLPLLAYTVARVILTIFVALYGFGALALAYTYVFGEIFHFIIALFLFRRYPIEKPSLSYFKSYIKFALPMSIASASYIIMTNIDKVFIQLFWASEQVGHYFAIFNLSYFVILLISSVGLLLFPTISEYHTKNDMKKIKKIVSQSERYLSMIVFPIVIVMVVLARPIIHILLSDKYLPALPVLQILPFFVLMEALARPYVSTLQGMDMPNLIRNRILLMMIINVVLDLILVPPDIRSLNVKLVGLGTEGAAIATVASYIIGLIYIRFKAWKITRIKGNPKIILHATASVFMGSILWYLLKLTHISRWYHLLIIALIGGGIYIVILFILKEFKKEDFDFFRDTLNIKKMLIYVRNEIKNM